MYKSQYEYEVSSLSSLFVSFSEILIVFTNKKTKKNRHLYLCNFISMHLLVSPSNSPIIQGSQEPPPWDTRIMCLVKLGHSNQRLITQASHFSLIHTHTHTHAGAKTNTSNKWSQFSQPSLGERKAKYASTFCKIWLNRWVLVIAAGKSLSQWL